MINQPSHHKINHVMTFTPETIPPIPNRVAISPSVASVLSQVIAASINELLKKASWSPAHVFAYNAITDVYITDEYYRDFCQVASDTLSFFARGNGDIVNATGQAIQRVPGLYVAKIIMMYPHIKSLIKPKHIDAAIQNLSTLNEIQNIAGIERQKTQSNTVPQIQTGEKSMNPQYVTAANGQQMVLFNGQYYTPQQWAMMQQQQNTMPNMGMMGATAGIPNIAGQVQNPQQGMAFNPSGQPLVLFNGQYYTPQQIAMMQQTQQQNTMPNMGMMGGMGMVQVGSNNMAGMVNMGGTTFGAPVNVGMGVSPYNNGIPGMGNTSFGAGQANNGIQSNQNNNYFSPYDMPQQSSAPTEQAKPLNNFQTDMTYTVTNQEYYTNPQSGNQPQMEEVTFQPIPKNVHEDTGPSASSSDTRIPDVFGTPFKTDKNTRPLHKTLINLEEYTRVWDVSGKEYIVKKDNLMNRDDHTIPILGGTVELNVEMRRKAFEREINNASKLSEYNMSEVRELIASKEEDITEEGRELLAQARSNFLLEEEVIGSVNSLVTSLQAEQSVSKGMVMTGTAYLVHAVPTQKENNELWAKIKASTSLLDLSANLKAIAKAMDQLRNNDRIKSSDYVDSLIWLNGIDKHFTDMLNEFFVVQFNDMGMKIDSFMTDFPEAHQYVMGQMSEVFRSIWIKFDRGVINRLKSNDGTDDIEKYIATLSASFSDATFSYHAEHISVTALNVLYSELGITIEAPLAHRVDSERNSVLYALIKTIFSNSDSLKNGMDNVYLVTRDNVRMKAHRGLLDSDNFMLSLA